MKLLPVFSVLFALFILIFPLASAQESLNAPQPEEVQPPFFQQIIDNLESLVDILRLMLIEVEEISDKNTTVIVNLSDEECEFEEYNFEETLALSASQGVAGSGAVLERYYDFESVNEVIDGVFNLTNFEGNPTLETEDALIGKSGRVSVNNNWNILGDEDTNLGSGADKSFNFWIRGENIGVVQFQEMLWKGAGGSFRVRAQDGLFCFGSVIAGAGCAGTINNFQWYMVTIVKDSTQASVYINGALDETGFSALGDSTEEHFIGVRADGTNEIIGLFDEMSWWSSALTPNDISILYNGGQGRLATELNDVVGNSEDSQTILIPQEFEYGNFSVLGADIEAACTGDCSYAVNGIKCGEIQDGLNIIPQECLDSFVGGFNDLELIVGNSSNGVISNLRLNSQVRPANC